MIGRRTRLATAGGFAALTVGATAALAGGVAGISPTECGTYSGGGCAPVSERIDLAAPRFSHPTRITNPLFPISRLHSAVLLGRVDGKPFRSETTLLPTTGTVRWNGKRVKVLLSQYMAFSNGRLEEVALDRYAQADDGSVWYLGEDVFDYRGGAVAITEGTWLAGRDGPPAMIMPARPRVGDVFRTENTTGVVFEEVTITETRKEVAGPRGPVANAIVGSELHLDESTSDKMFAPGYGEFYSAHDGDVEALALAVPTDALGPTVSPALRFLTTGAYGILENSRLADWDAATSTMGRLDSAVAKVLPDAPRLHRAPLRAKVTTLRGAIKARNAARVAQLTLDVAQLALDLELRHRAVADVDIDRFHLWTQRLRADAAARNRTGVAGDVAVLGWLRDRLTGVLGPAGTRRLDEGLAQLRGAADAGNLAATADHAARLGAEVRRWAATGARS